MRITKDDLLNAAYNQYCFVSSENCNEGYCYQYPTCKESIFLDMENDEEDFELDLIIKPSLLDKTLKLWNKTGFPEIKLVEHTEGSFIVVDLTAEKLFKKYAFLDLFVMCIKAATKNANTLIEGISEYKEDWMYRYKTYIGLSNLQLKRIDNYEVLSNFGLMDLCDFYYEKLEQKVGKRKL